MSEDLSQGNFFWENPTWVFLNSETLSGNEDKKGKKPLLPSSNSPTPIQTPIATQTPTPIPSTPVEQKRSPTGVPKTVSGGSSGGVGGSGGSGSGEWTKSVGGVSEEHEVHIWTERERRKKMRNMFTNLHALLPQLSSKADKSTIVDEAVSYIKSLQQTLQTLQRKKLERIRGATAFNYGSSMLKPPTLSFNSRETHLADHVSSLKLDMTANTPQPQPQPQLFSSPRFPVTFQTWSTPNIVLNVHGEDAHISICAPKKPGLLTTLLCVLEKHRLEVVTVQVSSDYYRSMFMLHAHASTIFDQLQEALPVEETFKLAVTEMIFKISC